MTFQTRFLHKKCTGEEGHNMRMLFLAICAWILFLPTWVQAQNLKQITARDGLSGSVVTCVHQTANGMLLVGTLDGLNLVYGGKAMRPIDIFPFEGEIIEHIVGTINNDLWVHTTHGLHKIGVADQAMKSFPQFTGYYISRAAGPDCVAVYDSKKRLQIYNAKTEEFEAVDYPQPRNEKIIDMGGTEDFFWTVTRSGIFRHTWSRTGDNRIGLSPAKQLVTAPDDVPIIYSCVAADRRSVFYIDRSMQLHRLEISSGKSFPILQMGAETALRGLPCSIVENEGSYFVSFKVNGILKYDLNTNTGEWTHTDLGIKSGVWQIAKDRYQNLIWIATDGQGLFTTKDDTYTFRSFCYSDFNHNLGKPVRALFLDKDEWLWVGTKGEGLLGIDRSDDDRPIYACKQHLFTAANSPLKDNSVYALEESTHGGFWIGTEEGVNFFSYKDRTVQRVAGSESVIYVHSIHECGDSVLWIATVGAGVFRAKIENKGGTIALRDVQQYKREDGKPSSNYFFAMHHAADGSIWLGNRGYGVFRMGAEGPEPVRTPSKQHSYLLNDVFALQEHGGTMWAGTGGGLTGFGPHGEEYYIDTDAGLPNNIIHALQADNHSGLWIATNNGLARLDSTFKKIQSYGDEDGLRVTEFSDGASYFSSSAKDGTDGRIYFGGVNGWVEVTHNPHYIAPDTYRAPLQFIRLQSNNAQVNLSSPYSATRREQETPHVELSQDDNDFTISFAAIDHINPRAYRYKYMLATEMGGEWMDIGAETSLSLNRLVPDDYTLRLKYYNPTTGTESPPIEMSLIVRPHWWNTTLMKILYLLLGAGTLIYIIGTKYRRMKLRHYYAMKALEQQHKEELYEEKLRFFTNITHEFSTPLTLISVPCERILSHPGTDDFVRKYVQHIRQHAARLHQLVQEMIAYRRIETGHQKLYVRPCDLSAFLHESCDTFVDAAEKKGIEFRRQIEPELTWHTDIRILPNVVSNLLSNAIKYTPRGGTLRVGLARLGDCEVEIRVYNTGPGIRPEDRQYIFSRYSLLDNAEGVSNDTPRNGLGMAICYSSAKLLGGDIEILSEPEHYAEFVVKLPLLGLSPESEAPERAEPATILPATEPEEAEEALPAPVPAAKPEAPKDAPSILVVDDNADILALLADILTPSYHVRTAANATEALEQLHAAPPALIITDVMMPGMDGIQLTEQIKQNPHTMHIPLVILSAKHTEEAKTQGTLSGADAYIGKPFGTEFLLATVRQLIASRRGMKQYYNTSASAFDYMDGRLMKKEDKAFIRKFNKVLEDNMQHSDITKEDLAAAMNTSVRTLYRRFKDLGLPSPKEYLREMRMKRVEKLLVTTDQSIQEIIYACGFNNRTHFYKEFSARFGMTPKEFRQQKKTKADENP